jgi:circadian clock protein KaiC
VFPRLEAVHAELEPTWHDPQERLAFGISGLDAMLDGGLSVGTSTLILGPPGGGKTIAGLHFLAEGARRGEPGLIAGFQETAASLASTADRAGMNLSPHLDSGLVRVMWRPSLELAPDAWASQLLAAVDEQRPRRVVIDAFSDLLRHFALPERVPGFATALANNLRDRGVTGVFILEVDKYVGPDVTIPVPNLSATMDTGILLRPVELRSSLRRLVSILKQRESGFDPAMREFTIGPEGISVGDPFEATALLTGIAAPRSDA